jgi:hypothetical protein
MTFGFCLEGQSRQPANSGITCSGCKRPIKGGEEYYTDRKGQPFCTQCKDRFVPIKETSYTLISSFLWIPPTPITTFQFTLFLLKFLNFGLTLDIFSFFLVPLAAECVKSVVLQWLEMVLKLLIRCGIHSVSHVQSVGQLFLMGVLWNWTTNPIANHVRIKLLNTNHNEEHLQILETTLYTIQSIRQNQSHSFQFFLFCLSLNSNY